METISFTLGVASALVVLLGTVTVWVAFRVKNLTKENQNLIYSIDRFEQYYNKRMGEIENNHSNEIKEIYNTFHSKIDEVCRVQETKTNDLERETDRRFDDCFRYMDSRVDKLLNLINTPKISKNKDKELLTD